MPHRRRFQPSTEAMAITPADLIGAARVAEILGIDKSNVTRRAATGSIPALAQLDGPGGAYVFNQPDILALVGSADK
jgi:hypothetical protein